MARRPNYQQFYSAVMDLLDSTDRAHRSLDTISAIFGTDHPAIRANRTRAQGQKMLMEKILILAKEEL